MASAILFRAAAPIFRRFFETGAVATAADADAALFGGRPRLFGAVPSIERTWAICSSNLVRVNSRPERAAFSTSLDSAGVVGILKIIVQKSGSVFFEAGVGEAMLRQAGANPRCFDSR